MKKLIESIIEFSAKNRLIVIILVAALALVGLYAIRSVPLDALPDLSDTQVIIYSRWDRSPDILLEEPGNEGPTWLILKRS